MRDFIFNGLSHVTKVGVTPFWPSGFVFYVFSVRLLAELPVFLTEYISCRFYYLY